MSEIIQHDTEGEKTTVSRRSWLKLAGGVVGISAIQSEITEVAAASDDATHAGYGEAEYGMEPYGGT